MNIQIIKRLAALEAVIQEPEAPDTVKIFFDWDRKQFRVAEDFIKVNSRGKVAGGLHTRITFLDHYRDFLFTGRFHGKIIIDLLDCPEEYAANLFCFEADKLRNEAGIDREDIFSIEIGKEAGFLKTVCIVTQYA